MNEALHQEYFQWNRVEMFYGNVVKFIDYGRYIYKKNEMKFKTKSIVSISIESNVINTEINGKIL